MGENSHDCISAARQARIGPQFGSCASRRRAQCIPMADRRVRQQFLPGYPVISVDTKNKELVGNFANQGRCWRQTPEQVNLHDFPGDALGRAVPYGIYDILHNRYLYLGNSYDTPEFAAHARTVVGRPATGARGQALDPL